MGYKYFYINIFIRIVLIFLTALAFGFFVYKPFKAYTSAFLFSLLVIESILLFLYINRINKNLINFLVALKDKDSSVQFDEKAGSFGNLTKLLNDTVNMLQKSRMEAQAQYHFLQFVIENSSVGLLAFDQNHSIEFINKTAKETLGILTLNDINTLSRLHNDLPGILKGLLPGHHKQLKINREDEQLLLMINASLIKFHDKKIKLISIQNVKAEMDKKEMESWQKLIRVLTHEIMNSITPITNLTYSIRRTLQEDINDNEKNTSDGIKEAIEDTEIIEQRSKNLIQFVENYRKLTKVSTSHISPVNICTLIENIFHLMREDLKNQNVECINKIQKEIVIQGDEKLLEQAFINIIKNALEAIEFKTDGRIEITAQDSKEKITIKVTDNGKGIEQNKLDDIFIPFFSTKEHGSGIGLSLVKQIIQLHGGTVVANSAPAKGTIFIIKLKKDIQK